jgi:hypothetical protein
MSTLYINLEVRGMLRLSALLFNSESKMIGKADPCFFPSKSTLSVRYCSPRMSVRRS